MRLLGSTRLESALIMKRPAAWTRRSQGYIFTGRTLLIATAGQNCDQSKAATILYAILCSGRAGLVLVLSICGGKPSLSRTRGRRSGCIKLVLIRAGRVHRPTHYLLYTIFWPGEYSVTLWKQLHGAYIVVSSLMGLFQRHTSIINVDRN